jgi:hypothetical protein
VDKAAPYLLFAANELPPPPVVQRERDRRPDLLFLAIELGDAAEGVAAVVRWLEQAPTWPGCPLFVFAQRLAPADRRSLQRHGATVFEQAAAPPGCPRTATELVAQIMSFFREITLGGSATAVAGQLPGPPPVRLLALDLDQVTDEAVVDRALRWVEDFRSALRSPSRPSVFAPPVVVFTSRCAPAEQQRLREGGMSVYDRRREGEFGIRDVRRLVTHLVHAQPQLAYPPQPLPKTHRPQNRPDARPEDYAGYPPGLTPADLTPLFQAIRGDRDAL